MTLISCLKNSFENFKNFEIQDNFEQIHDDGHFMKIQDCPLKKHADGTPIQFVKYT